MTANSTRIAHRAIELFLDNHGIPSPEGRGLVCPTEKAPVLAAIWMGGQSAAAVEDVSTQMGGIALDFKTAAVYLEAATRILARGPDRFEKTQSTWEDVTPPVTPPVQRQPLPENYRGTPSVWADAANDQYDNDAINNVLARAAAAETFSYLPCVQGDLPAVREQNDRASVPVSMIALTILEKMFDGTVGAPPAAQDFDVAIAGNRTNFLAVARHINPHVSCPLDNDITFITREIADQILHAAVAIEAAAQTGGKITLPPCDELDAWAFSVARNHLNALDQRSYARTVPATAYEEIDSSYPEDNTAILSSPLNTDNSNSPEWQDTVPMCRLPNGCQPF